MEIKDIINIGYKKFISSINIEIMIIRPNGENIVSSNLLLLKPNRGIVKKIARYIINNIKMSIELIFISIFLFK
jgi:hypothetical protein